MSVNPFNGIMERYKPKEITDAIKETGGVLSEAARLLGCSRQTMYNYFERHPEIEAVYREETEKSLDEAEAVLMDYVRGRVPYQTRKEQISAARYLLRTKGKHRGYR